MRLVFFSLLGALTLIPLARLLNILLTYGTNNPGSDDIIFASLIDRILHGTYPWNQFFKDTFFSSPDAAASAGHSDAFPVLLQVLLAYLTPTYLYTASIYVGLGLTAVKLLLLWDMFTFNSKSFFRWFLLPLIFALGFSLTQISVFEWGLASIEQGFNQLGIVLGIWSLLRFQNRWIGMILMGFGGLLSSWSWGNGPLVWPIFFVGMMFFGFTKPKFILTWLGFAILGCLPFIYHLVLNRASGQEVILARLFLGFFNWSFWIKALGWPMISSLDANAAIPRGVIGLILLTGSLLILLTRRWCSNFFSLIPTLLFLSYGIFSIFLISGFRMNLAPWYSAPFMIVWLGLIGISYNFIVIGQKIVFSEKGLKYPEKWLGLSWGTVTLAVIILLYFLSNSSFIERSYFLRTRSYTSASCLRNYDQAPTDCELYLFVFHPGHWSSVTALGRLMEHSQLSVFGKKQKWTLQGEYFLADKVKIIEEKDIPKVLWSPDLKTTPAPFYDPRQLNLFLHSPNAVEWMVSLPEYLKNAELYSAVAISESAPFEGIADGVLFSVSIQEEGGQRADYFNQYVGPAERKWLPFKISLSRFKGKTVTIRFSSNMVGNIAHDWAMYRFPYIDLELNEQDLANTEVQRTLRPSNTDLAKNPVTVTDKDYIFNLDNNVEWEKRGIVSVGQGTMVGPIEVLGYEGAMEHKSSLNVCLSEYSHLYFKTGLLPKHKPRAMKLFFQFDKIPGYQEIIWIPMLPDGDLHAYSYDLRFLEQYRDSKLTGIKIRPVLGLPNWLWKSFEISDLRLIARPSGQSCN